MELFNIENFVKYHDFKNVESVDFSSLILNMGEQGAISYIKNLKRRGVLFGISDLDFSSSILLPLVLAASPIYVSFIKYNSNQLCGSFLEPSKGFSSYGLEVLKLLENFNVCIDLKNMSSLSRFDALLNTTKSLMCSNCKLSSSSAKNRLSSYEEELLVKRDSLLLLSLDKVDELTFSIVEFASRYGIKNLAVDIRGFNNSKINKIKAELQYFGLENQEIERLLYKNANAFFELQLMS